MLGATYINTHSHTQNMYHGKCVENMCAKLFVDYPGKPSQGIYVQIYHIHYFLQSSFYSDTAKGRWTMSITMNLEVVRVLICAWLLPCPNSLQLKMSPDIICL